MPDVTFGAPETGLLDVREDRQYRFYRARNRIDYKPRLNEHNFQIQAGKRRMVSAKWDNKAGSGRKRLRSGSFVSLCWPEPTCRWRKSTRGTSCAFGEPALGCHLQTGIAQFENNS
jgi:hypothetical protein